MNKFPYSNFHDINLDWILSKLKNAVFSVNGQQPDDDGNIDLPSVAGVSSVNGVGPDSLGNVTLTASDVSAMPDSYSAPVSSVNNKTGAVSLTAFDIGAMPAGYVPPVTSVNTLTGDVVLTASDVGALPDTYTPPVESVNGMTGNVVLDYSDVNALPDTTVIPTLTSQLTNDSGFITSQQAGAVLSVNGQVGAVVLDASDVSALPDTTVIPTATSQLVNDSGFITSAQAAPVDSVNGYIGAVVLDASDVGAAPAAAGMPTGGYSGQVLAKNSATDYDAVWVSCGKWTKLWDNPDITQNYTTGTATWADGGYSFYCVIFNLFSSRPYTSTVVIVPVGAGGIANIPVTSNVDVGTFSQAMFRRFDSSTTQISFSACRLANASTNDARNDGLIPVTIFGIQL